MKKYFLTFLFLFTLIPCVYGLDTSLKIYDDANLLTDEEEIRLKSAIDDYIENYDMDMVLTTTRTNPYSSPREYASKFYDNYGFGLNDKRDGILMLIDRSEGYNDVYILTTGEAIRVYSDMRIEYMLDDIEEQVSNGHYWMFQAFIKSASKYAASGVPTANQNAYIDSDGNIVYPRQYPFFLILLISLVVSSVIVGILLAKNKMVKKATSAGVYLDQNSINLARREDIFIHTHTTTVHIPRNTGSGGISSGGGSHSSGGHGGGGRRM